MFSARTRKLPILRVRAAKKRGANPTPVYQAFFTQRFPQQSIQRYGIPLLIYSTRNQGVIEQWQ